MDLIKTVFFVALAALLLFLALTWSGSDRDLAAYVRGDYAAAAEQFRAAAERGEAKAQHYLALLYDNGQGVAQDDAEALKWYRRAAEQGYAAAEYNLSMMYFFGKGVAQDYVEAYKWLVLADAHGERIAGEALAKLAEKMSPEQIAQAQAAVQAWRAEHGQ